MNTSLKESEQAVRICQAIEYHFGLDLIVRTPAELAQRLALGDPFLQEAVKKGKGSMNALTFELQRSLLVVLDRYAASFRYPGESADRAEARQAFHAATDFREFARAKLGI